MRLPIFTEDEFVRLLDTGISPEWFENVGHETRDTKSKKLGSHNDEIDLDHLSYQFLIRMLHCLFGQKRVPRKMQTAITHSILENAELQGLVVEQEPIGTVRSFVSTDRMTKYWSRIFEGDLLSVPDRRVLQTKRR